MSAPTVRGRPWFNTTFGYRVHIRVVVDEDPPFEWRVTQIRAWGESSKTNKTCINYRTSTNPKIDVVDEDGIGLVWDSEGDAKYVSTNPHAWALYDEERPYYRICAEVTLKDAGENEQVVYTCYVWQVPPDFEEEYPLHVLADCV